MDIGQKLKTARAAAGLTQEAVAEALGVSRQTISNWENSRTYPDIVSVIRLSDLYDISLDALLKEDKKMISHLQENTDAVGSRRRLSKLLLILAYLVIWSLLLILFWWGMDPGDAFAYGLVTFWVVLPITTLVLSFLIGKDGSWAHWKWAMLLFFGLMYLAADYGTFSLANTLSTGQLHQPEWAAFFPGALCSAAGLALGTLFRVLSQRNSRAAQRIQP